MFVCFLYKQQREQICVENIGISIKIFPNPQNYLRFCMAILILFSCLYRNPTHPLVPWIEIPAVFWLLQLNFPSNCNVLYVFLLTCIHRILIIPQYNFDWMQVFEILTDFIIGWFLLRHYIEWDLHQIRVYFKTSLSTEPLFYF